MEQNRNFIFHGWVKAVIVTNQKGFTEDMLNKWRYSGKVIEGVHWKKHFGVILYNYEKLDEFIENAGITA